MDKRYISLLEAEISRVFVKTSQAAVYRRCRAKHHITAQVVTAHFAKLTYPTGYARLDGDAIANLRKNPKTHGVSQTKIAQISYPR